MIQSLHLSLSRKLWAFGPRVSVVRPQTERDLKLIVSFHPEAEFGAGGYHSAVEHLIAEGEWWLVSLGRPHLGQKAPKKRTQQRLWSTQQVLLSLQPGHSRGPLPRPGALFFFSKFFFFFFFSVDYFLKSS